MRVEDAGFIIEFAALQDADDKRPAARREAVVADVLHQHLTGGRIVGRQRGEHLEGDQPRAKIPLAFALRHGDQGGHTRGFGHLRQRDGGVIEILAGKPVQLGRRFRTAVPGKDFERRRHVTV